MNLLFLLLLLNVSFCIAVKILKRKKKLLKKKIRKLFEKFMNNLKSLEIF